MEVYARVRRAIQVDGMSQREAARQFGLARKTIRKMMAFSIPPGYERKKPVAKPKLGPWQTNALDQAAPLQGWQLPGEFAELRRRMEARLAKRGRREYVQVLRLLETFSLAEVTAAVQHALALPAISFDAVKHLLLCALEQRPPKLDLENYLHLPTAEVALTRAADYQVLLEAHA